MTDLSQLCELNYFLGNSRQTYARSSKESFKQLFLNKSLVPQTVVLTVNWLSPFFHFSLFHCLLCISLCYYCLDEFFFLGSLYFSTLPFAVLMT